MYTSCHQFTDISRPISIYVSSLGGTGHGPASSNARVFERGQRAPGVAFHKPQVFAMFRIFRIGMFLIDQAVGPDLGGWWTFAPRNLRHR